MDVSIFNLHLSSKMLEKYPTRAQEFIKYMRDIRMDADRFSNDWFIYDEQFCLRKASDPHSSWGTINSKLWLMYVNNNSQAHDKPQMPALPVNIPGLYNANKTITPQRPLALCNFATLLMQASIVNLLQIAGIHMSAVYVLEATPQPDAEAITPSNKVLNTLGTTPIDVYTLSSYLKDYKAKSFIINGFLHGLHLQYSGPRLFREAKNLKSALSNTHIVQQKIKKEISLQRVGGPFQYPPFPSIQVSPLGLVPKNDGDYCQSINSFIDPLACTVHYASIDDAASIISALGPEALVSKSDVKSAFRLIPIAPSDFDLLGFKSQEKYYFQLTKCCHMGLQSAVQFGKSS